MQESEYDNKITKYFSLARYPECYHDVVREFLLCYDAYSAKKMNNITGKALDILKGQKLGFGPVAVNEVMKVNVFGDGWHRRP